MLPSIFEGHGGGGRGGVEGIKSVERMKRGCCGRWMERRHAHVDGLLAAESYIQEAGQWEGER